MLLRRHAARAASGLGARFASSAAAVASELRQVQEAIEAIEAGSAGHGSAVSTVPERLGEWWYSEGAAGRPGMTRRRLRPGAEAPAMPSARDWEAMKRAGTVGPACEVFSPVRVAHDMARSDCERLVPAEWSDIASRPATAPEEGSMADSLRLSACGRLFIALSDLTCDDHGHTGALYQLPERPGQGARLLCLIPGAVNATFARPAPGAPSGIILWTCMSADGTLRSSRVGWAPVSWEDAARKSQRAGAGAGARAAVGPARALFEEGPGGVPGPDGASFFVDVAASKDGLVATVNCNDRHVSEVWAVTCGADVGADGAEGPAPRVRALWPRSWGGQCFVEHIGDGQLLAMVSAPAGSSAGSSGDGTDGTMQLATARLGDFALASGEALRRRDGPATAAALAGADRRAWEQVSAGASAGRQASSEPEDMDVLSLSGHGEGRRGAVAAVLGRRFDGAGSSLALWRPVSPAEGAAAARPPWRSEEVPVPRNVCELVPGANADPEANALSLVLRSPVALPRSAWLDVTDGETGSGSATLREASAPGEAARAMRQAGLPPLAVLHLCVESPAGAVSAAADTPGPVAAARVPLTVVLPLAALSEEGPGRALPGTAIATDGAEVREPAVSVPRPVLLDVYGAYGSPSSAALDPNWAPLLRRGWAIAFPRLRGGGDCGAAWARAGRGAGKGATLEDAWAAAQALVGWGVAKQGSVAVRGVSAGGAVAAWCLTRQARRGYGPFGAGVLTSPFLDVLGTMSDPMAPLAAVEYSEFGRPGADGLPVAAWDPMVAALAQAMAFGDPGLGSCAAHTTELAAARRAHAERRWQAPFPPTLVLGVEGDSRTPQATARAWAATVSSASSGLPGARAVEVVDLRGGHGTTSPEHECSFLIEALGEADDARAVLASVDCDATAGSKSAQGGVASFLRGLLRV